jgi:GNAT superfamily N-acetyltransferase
MVALAMSAPQLDDLSFRHPIETDHARVVEVVDEWWGGRKMRALLPRLWFQHFSGTSWLLETTEGRLAGFVVAFISQDDPTTGYVHMIASDPNWRRAGIGRVLYERVFGDLSARGVRRVKAITWPGNRSSVAFHTALGFGIDDGPGTQRLYGIPAYPDFDGWGEDRVVFTKDL